MPQLKFDGQLAVIIHSNDVLEIILEDNTVLVVHARPNRSTRIGFLRFETTLGELPSASQRWYRQEYEKDRRKEREQAELRRHTKRLLYAVPSPADITLADDTPVQIYPNQDHSRRPAFEAAMDLRISFSRSGYSTPHSIGIIKGFNIPNS